MFALVLAVSLSGPLDVQPVSDVQPCVWPNRCRVEAAPILAAVPFQPCVWPNRCRG